MARSVKQSCVTCRRFDAKPCDQVTAPLPAERVVHSAHFVLCGVEYAGPLLVRTSADPAKYWMALFFCGTKRALHLEMVSSLSVSDFLLAYRRFVARRGQSGLMLSDNAAQFKAAPKVVGVKWSFIPPASPLFWGFYERLVRSMKKPYAKCLAIHCFGQRSWPPYIARPRNSQRLTASSCG